MKRIYLKLLPVLFLGFTLATASCGKKNVTDEMSSKAPQTSEQSAQPEVVPDDKPATEEVKSQDLPANANGSVKYSSLNPGGDDLTKNAEANGKLFTIYFDYDKYNVRDDDKTHLDQNAKWLALNSKVKITVEGHADERGETEYNLALGDKRAKSIEKYLEDMGITKDRLATISYGEEKPADPGHDEGAWSKNRRAEFKIVN